MDTCVWERNAKQNRIICGNCLVPGSRKAHEPMFPNTRFFYPLIQSLIYFFLYLFILSTLAVQLQEQNEKSLSLL